MNSDPMKSTIVFGKGLLTVSESYEAGRTSTSWFHAQTKSRLFEIVARLGFKAARTIWQDAPPGVLDFFGHDSATGKIVHLHLHLTLIAGDRLTTNYLISLAEPYLAAAAGGTLFRMASPEFEYILFVIRMTLDATGRSAALDPTRRSEMEYLHERVEQDKIAALLAEHFPSLANGLFQACSDALRGEAGRFRLAKLRRQLQRELSVFARRSNFSNSLMRFLRRAAGLENASPAETVSQTQNAARRNHYRIDWR